MHGGSPSSNLPIIDCVVVFLYITLYHFVSVENLLPVNDLDPIKRYLSASERPRVSHRYMSFEVSLMR